jgi:hypothetical protein
VSGVPFLKARTSLARPPAPHLSEPGRSAFSQTSKACVRCKSPWVQIPPLPPASPGRCRNGPHGPDRRFAIQSALPNHSLEDQGARPDDDGGTGGCSTSGGAAPASTLTTTINPPTARLHGSSADVPPPVGPRAMESLATPWTRRLLRTHGAGACHHFFSISRGLSETSPFLVCSMPNQGIGPERVPGFLHPGIPVSRKT